MYQIDYTDEQWRDAILALDLADWLRDWSLVQVDRTQGYYISRIAQLGMQGERVLDAGCGMGNWSMGLARYYQRVDAIEIDLARLDVLRAVCPHFHGKIVPEVGSVHELPYPDASFDGVFCNGVLFVTDYRKTLAEFRRVLKPGGKLYVTYCGMEWWTNLLLERGAKEPDCVTYGANGLLHYLWSLLDKLNIDSSALDRDREQLLEAISATFSVRPHRNLFGKKKFHQSLVAETGAKVVRGDALDYFVTLFCAALSSNTNDTNRCTALRAIECLNILVKSAPEDYLARLLRDISSRLETGRSDYAMSIDTWTFSPEEMSAEITSRGFMNALSSREGCLNLGGRQFMVPPIYGERLGVFETLATRAR